MIGERMEVTPMIGIGPRGIYHFGYPLFQALPDVTTKVNSFDDFNFFLLHRLWTLLYLDFNEPDSSL